MRSLMNRFSNCMNKYQGDTKKVLCVCSAGLLRSPTAAVVLSQEPFNYNTRAVGVSQEYALMPVESVHLEWADEIVCMEGEHEVALLSQFHGDTDDIENIRSKIKVLGIPDSFPYRDPALMKLIQTKYAETLT